MRKFAWILLGIGIGLLVAPRPGRETRQRLRARVRRARGSVESGAPGHELADAVEQTVEHAHQIVEQG